MLETQCGDDASLYQRQLSTRGRSSRCEMFKRLGSCRGTIPRKMSLSWRVYDDVAVVMHSTMTLNDVPVYM